MSRKVRKAKSNNNSRLIGIDARTQLKNITPITPAQEEVFNLYEIICFFMELQGQEKHIFLYTLH